MFMTGKDKYYLFHIYMFILPCACFRAEGSTVKAVDSQQGVES